MNIVSFLEFRKNLVKDNEFFKAIIWFKRTIDMLEDKKHTFESNLVKLHIELIRVL